VPLFLYAWSMWRQGNGAVASLAVGRALVSGPSLTAGELLVAAISSGIDPRTLPPLADSTACSGQRPADPAGDAIARGGRRTPRRSRSGSFDHD